jgi:ADP-ribosylglycohydrolase
MSDLTTAEDRCRGVLIGLAAGDRIGGPIRMALRLAESLVETDRFDAGDVLGRYLAWWQQGAFDTGTVSARALALVAAGMPVEDATAQVHREAGGMTAGCNPAHRSPPLAMLASLADHQLVACAVAEARLGRLGMQASNRLVVASLAAFGIDVTEGQVRQVKVEMLKEAASVERQKVMVPGRCKRRQIRLPPKIQHPGRGHRP